MLRECNGNETKIPFKTLKYLISKINYGGSIGGNQDASVADELLESIMNAKCLTEETFDLQGDEDSTVVSAVSGRGIYIMPPPSDQ